MQGSDDKTRTVTFPYIDHCDDFSSFGFIRISSTDLIFSLSKISAQGKWRNFVEKYFDDFAKAYYWSMKFEHSKAPSRKRKLKTFLKSIFEQDEPQAALLMVKSVAYFCDKLDEETIIEKTIKEVLPNAGFFKTIINGRYIWKADDEKRFKKGIGLVFVLSYISNRFNKDDTWKYIKKFCYLKDNVWSYKNDKCKDVVQKCFLSYFKDEGVVVKEFQLKDGKFNTFIPFEKIYGENNEDMGKVYDGDDYPMVKGIASTTGIDRDDERVSKNFIAKMRSTAKGLPITDNTHNPNKAADTVGVITETYGTDDKFGLVAKLMKTTDSTGVDFIMKQVKTGINYGFSIGGRVTKVFREFNEKMKKEVWVLDDGELYHVALTTQPANAETFANVVKKMISDEGLDKMISSDLIAYKHNSKLMKNAPTLESLTIDKLPDAAFPIGCDDSIHKEYPHHFINDKNVMFLHKDLLINSYKKAIEKKAPESVLLHLITHLQVIGLSKQVDELIKISDTIENLNGINEVTKQITDEMSSYFKAVQTVGQLQVGIDEKKKILKNYLTDASTKISKILNSVEKED